MTETYVIHITKKCNLACHYCYEQDKTSEYTFDDIKLTIDNIFAHVGDNVVSVEFLGGEPMLRWDLIEKSYEYMEYNYAKSIHSYIITTNGTILNNQIISYLKNNGKIHFAVSLDGNKYSNQLRVFKNYQNSHDVVVAHIKKLIEYGCPSIGVHMVTHPYNVGFLFDNVKYLYNMGIKNIGIGTVESTMEIDEDYVNMFKYEMRMVSEFVKNNTDLQIDILESVKPVSDVRTYVRDKTTNKVIFETYGRIEDDVLSKLNGDYIIERCDSVSDRMKMINEIREYSHNYHKGI